MLEKKGRVCEGNTNAQKEKWEGEEYQNPSQTLYHKNNDSSIPYEEYFPKTFGMGIKEKKCAWCGKNFCPTPEWAYGECCRYTCALRHDEQKQEELHNGKEVVMLNPETKTDLMTFKNAKEAAEAAKTTAKDIRLVCNGLRRTAGGKGWRWADEPPLQIVDIIPEYDREPKVSKTMWVRESTAEKLEELAKKNGISVNRMAATIIERELNKEYDI